MAPEMIEGRPYNGEKIDIFSTGVSLFAMIYLAYPFGPAASKTDTFYKFVIREKWDKFWKMHKSQ